MIPALKDKDGINRASSLGDVTWEDARKGPDREGKEERD